MTTMPTTDPIAEILALQQNGFNPPNPFANMGQQQATAAPFVWGQGGARLSPEQLAEQQDAARQQAQGDYSPVGSVWEGLGRVAGNVTGALDSKRLGKEAVAATADRDAQIAALLGPNADPRLAAGLGSADPRVAGVAEALFKASQPKTQNPTDFQQMLQAGGVMPGTPEYAAQNLARAQSLSDPLVTVSLPDGGIFNGPASQLAAVLKGGGQASGVAPGMPPAPAQLPTSPVGRLTPIGGSGSGQSGFP